MLTQQSGSGRRATGRNDDAAQHRVAAAAAMAEAPALPPPHLNPPGWATWIRAGSGSRSRRSQPLPQAAGIPYKHTAAGPLLLDAYRTGRGDGHPLVVMIHGGGWHAAAASRWG